MVVGSGRARANPIDDRDLAEVIANTFTEPPGLVEVGGPEVLTRREMWRAEWAARGQRGWLVPVPAFLARIHVPLAPPHGTRTLEQVFREPTGR